MSEFHIDPWASAFLDEELTEEEQQMVEAHLSECERCRLLLTDLRQISLDISSFYGSATASERIEQSVLETLDLQSKASAAGRSNGHPEPYDSPAVGIESAIESAGEESDHSRRGVQFDVQSDTVRAANTLPGTWMLGVLAAVLLGLVGYGMFWCFNIFMPVSISLFHGLSILMSSNTASAAGYIVSTVLLLMAAGALLIYVLRDSGKTRRWRT